MHKLIHTLIGLAFLLLPVIASSEPLLDITIVVVPETEACKPSGYRSYGDEGGSSCQALTANDFDEWRAYGYRYVKRGIPPGQISLGKNLLRAPRYLEWVAT